MKFVTYEPFYENVTEYVGDSTNGKIEYTYGNVSHATGDQFVAPEVRLLDQKTYKRTTSGYALVQQSSSEYAPVYTGYNNLFSDPVDPLERRFVIRDVTQTAGEIIYNKQGADGQMCWCKAYIDNVFAIACVPIRQTKTIEKQFDPANGDSIMSVSLFYYDDSLNLNPTRIKTTDSKGDTLVTKMIYPTGSLLGSATLTSPEASALAKLLADNFTSTPVYTEQSNQTLTQTLAKSLRTFQEVSSKALLKTEKTYPMGGSSFREATITSYDTSARPLEFIGPDGLYQSMVYDKYGNTIAYAKNAQWAVVAATSFENGGKGSWTFSGTAASDATAPTGTLAYALSSGSVVSPALSTGQSYFVSYWLKGTSALSLTGTQSGWPKTLNTLTIGGQTWTCFEHRITGVSGVTLSGSATIDELRLFPLGAEMSTFTYEPSIGMRSHCDLNNRLMYYEYDEAGRLSLVRDQNRNILKKVCYSYSGQTASCQ
jgi:hypothetical protein